MAETVGSDTRAFPRFDVYAAVSVRTGEELLILTVQNISLGGLFVLADDATRLHLPIGSSYELTLLPNDQDGGASIAVTALAMRHDSAGVGFMITNRGDGLASIIERLKT